MTVKERTITHSHLGTWTRIEQHGRELWMVFVAHSEEQATDFTDVLAGELRLGGALAPRFQSAGNVGETQRKG
ncbi:MAG TPA: hypothetical protein VGH62_11875 [Bradyrhizobium sp.]